MDKKTIFVITGASRGIGKTMAVECCRLFNPNSLAILFAHSSEGLEQTRKEILASNNSITVKVYSLDLGEATFKDYEESLLDALYHKSLSDARNGIHQMTDFELAFVIHNVGSVGNITTPAKELSEVDDWKKYYHLNIFGIFALNAAFLARFNDIPKLVVNVTSGAASIPNAMMAQYCSAKATREMFFKVLALEEKDTIVMNYSPGPVDTDFITNFLKELKDEDLNKFFVKIKQMNTTNQVLAARFLKARNDCEFKSNPI